MQKAYTTDDIQIDVVAHKQKVAVGENFQERITIHNETNSALPATRLVATSPSGYVRKCGVQVPQVPPYKEVTVELEVRVSPVVSVEQVDPVVTYSYHGVTITSAVPMYIFTGKLNQLRPYHQSAPHYNIVLFGIAGASKSSFMNSILALLSTENQLVHRAAVGGGEHHNSRKLAKFDLDDGIPVTLWDTWGLTPTTYTSGDLQLLLDGDLPSGWDMDFVYDQFREQLERNAGTKDSRAQHAVLFFIPHSSLDKQDETDLIKSTFDQVKHLNPILLLTRADEVDGSIRAAPHKPSADIIELKNQASRVLNIPFNRIFTTINYTTEKHKTFPIDRNTYEILETAIGIAEQNYINKYPQPQQRRPVPQTTTTSHASASTSTTVSSPSVTSVAPAPKPKPVPKAAPVFSW
eukprot:TRINITY_DN45_c0_g1_i1.p1 TRINITY_DN45_c0_g1~~TRINITY_DN45_c0_g1_i1.p1  ORF type:complete len:420 (+),score=73.50 TRINITY_DN45_c0_g1_i1:41-1261(+)